MSAVARTLCLAALCVAALLLGACDGLEGYRTGADERFVGSVVGVADPPVLRRGFSSQTTLSMSFEPDNLTSLREPPGRLTTSDGALTDEPLEPITPLEHDVLSEYEIPAGDRVRNYMFVIRPTEGPLAGREPMVFLSLMGDGSLEVRILAGGGSREGDYFGLFRLRRETVE